MKVHCSRCFKPKPELTRLEGTAIFLCKACQYALREWLDFFEAHGLGLQWPLLPHDERNALAELTKREEAPQTPQVHTPLPNLDGETPQKPKDAELPTPKAKRRK